MSNAKNDMRTEYRLEDLDKGVRGKYFARTSKEKMLVTSDNSIVNDLESEVILLKAVWELIDTAANFSMFEIVGEGPASEIRFPTPIHQRFFNIILVDLTLPQY